MNSAHTQYFVRMQHLIRRSNDLFAGREKRHSFCQTVSDSKHDSCLHFMISFNLKCAAVIERGTR